MLEFAPFLLALAVAALARHLASRVLVYRYYPLLERSKQSGERAKARIDAIDMSQMSEQKKADLSVQIYEEEGATMRPLVMFFLSSMSLWLGSVAIVWIVSSLSAGPFSQAVWWIPVVYFGIKLLVALPSTYEKQKESEVFSKLGARQQWSCLGCVIVLLMVLAAPVTVIYSLAPVGVVTFVALYWCLSCTLWWLFPYSKGDLPKVAMLFL